MEYVILNTNLNKYWKETPAGSIWTDCEKATRYAGEEIEEMITKGKFSLYGGHIVAVISM